MDVVNEILDAIEIIVDKKVRDISAQIYPGVCKSVSGNSCVMSINGRNNTVQFYGSTPTVGSIYRVFVPNGNMSMAFIIANNDGSSPSSATPSFYAPAGAGTSGQILVSSGSGAPTWKNPPESFHKYTATNGALTASGGAFTWSIPASTHGVSNVGIIVQLYQVSTGEMVIADVTVNQSNYNVTITINDTTSAGSLGSGTYRVVIFG